MALQENKSSYYSWETQNHIQMRQNQAHIFVRDFDKLVCKIKEVCAPE
jgi:hypothetical protein